MPNRKYWPGMQNVPTSAQPWSFIAAIEAYQRLMLIEDVAEVLGLSKSTVYRMAQKKQIPSLVIGGCRKFDPAALAMHYRKKSPDSAAAARLIAQGV